MEAISITCLLKILIIFSMVFLTYSSIMIFKFVDTNLKLKKMRIENEKYQIDINTNIVKDIDDKLDNIIEQCFEEYAILNLAYKSDMYITEDMEVKINKDILNKVSDRISEVFYKQLCIYYKEEAIPDIIAKRVFFKITSFTMDHNSGTGL